MISSSTFGQNWPSLQRGLSTIPELLVILHYSCGRLCGAFSTGLEVRIVQDINDVNGQRQRGERRLNRTPCQRQKSGSSTARTMGVDRWAGGRTRERRTRARTCLCTTAPSHQVRTRIPPHPHENRSTYTWVYTPETTTKRETQNGRRPNGSRSGEQRISAALMSRNSHAVSCLSVRFVGRSRAAQVNAGNSHRIAEASVHAEYAPREQRKA